MILIGDCIEQMKTLEANSVDCCITSPPYWGFRDYGVDGQLGLEKTPDEFVLKLTEVFREVRRVLKDDGTLWLNLGDSYAGKSQGNCKSYSDKQKSNRGTTRIDSPPAGLKSKDLVGIPWRVAFALQADGWYLRQDIIWHKPNPMPESVTDRCTKSHEYIFLLSKSPKYYFDHDAIKEPAINKVINKKATVSKERKDLRSNVESRHRCSIEGGQSLQVSPDGKRSKRSVWTVSTKPFKGAHFATFPKDLIEPCVLAGCPKGGTILDPFFGAGTVGLVASIHGRSYIGIELNPEYVKIAEQRMAAV